MAQRFDLSVADPGSSTFVNNAVIATGSTNSPVFRISCTGHDKIRLIIPVLNDKTPKTEETRMLVDKNGWDALSLKEEKLVNARIQKLASLPGVIELTTINNKADTEAVFSLDNFKTLSDPGIASCYLRYQKLVVINPDDPEDMGTLTWVDAPAAAITITKVKVVERPVITSFKADRYIISAGEEAILSWTTDKSHYCLLSINNIVQRDRLPAQGSFTHLQQGTGDRAYKLKACTNDSADFFDEKEISISVKGSSVSEIFSFLPADSTLMGLYPYGNNLYAIVLHKKPQLKAYLYASQSGMREWQQVFRYPDQPVELDARLAASPGVVFRDRLYLIGGSSFDPDQPGNDVGYYNFETKEWVSSAQMINKRFPTPRMGHACVVYNNEIWLLGGYDPARGTLRDIWTSGNGIAWTEASIDSKKITLPDAGRCMPGATVHNNELWIFGGFKAEPGGESYSYNDTYKWDGRSWGSRLDWSNNAKESLEKNDYKAVALASAKDSLFLFSTCRPDRVWRHTVFSIYKTNRWDIIDQATTNNWGMDEYGYSLQAVTYKSTVWIRALRPASSKEAGVRGKELYYFYYVPAQ